jgi:hypothetical protein
MIIEMDGEMIPTVNFDPGKDRRKNRKVAWEELRCCPKCGRQRMEICLFF